MRVWLAARVVSVTCIACIKTHISYKFHNANQHWHLFTPPTLSLTAHLTCLSAIHSMSSFSAYSRKSLSMRKKRVRPLKRLKKCEEQKERMNMTLDNQWVFFYVSFSLQKSERLRRIILTSLMICRKKYRLKLLRWSLIQKHVWIKQLKNWESSWWVCIAPNWRPFSLLAFVLTYNCRDSSKQGETESELSETQEYKDADEALKSYYELHGGELVMEAESEPKDLREDDY